MCNAGMQRFLVGKMFVKGCSRVYNVGIQRFLWETRVTPRGIKAAALDFRLRKIIKWFLFFHDSEVTNGPANSANKGV